MGESTLKRRLGTALATLLGVGYVPGAPGTAGSAVGVLVAWALYRAAGPFAIAVAAVLLLPVAIWSAAQAEEHYGEHDAQHIVIDELVGQLIALAATPGRPAVLLVGFGFFRLFDSVKPWPARRIDREVGGGLGVVLDDVAAGVQAALLTALLYYTGLIDWVLLRLLDRP